MDTSPTSSFSFERCKLVANRYLVLNQKTWITGLLGATGFLLALYLLQIWVTSSDFLQLHFSRIEGTAMLFFTIGGLIFTSTIFKEMHEPTKAFQFLTLPASSPEKFVAAWLVTFLGYTLIAVISIFLLSVLVELISAFRFNQWGNFQFFNPFEGDHLSRYFNYFYYQSAFLLGAAYFRKNHFVATVLSIIVFFFTVFIIVSTIGLFVAFFHDGSVSFTFDDTLRATAYYNIISVIFKIGAASLLLFLAYLQLKNKQVA